LLFLSGRVLAFIPIIEEASAILEQISAAVETLTEDHHYIYQLQETSQKAETMGKEFS
jgi:hypothetical protein